MTNLFDKAMPHRNDPPTREKTEHKCKVCGKWFSYEKFTKHKKTHE